MGACFERPEEPPKNDKLPQKAEGQPVEDKRVEEFVREAAEREVKSAMKGCAESAESLAGDAKTQKLQACRSSNARKALAKSLGKAENEVVYFT